MLLFGSVADAPNPVADVIGHQQRAFRVDRDADWPALGLALVVDETGQHIERLAGRPACAERDEDDFIAAERLPVPRSIRPFDNLGAVLYGRRLNPIALWTFR